MRIVEYALVKKIIDILDTTKIGNNTQLWGNSTKTVLAYSNATYKHIHNSSYMLPDDCSTFNPISSDTANTFGDFVEIITETDRAIDFHWANIVEVTAVGIYIIEFHEVSAIDLQVSEKYLGAISVSRLDNFTKASQMTVQIPVVMAGKRVACRVKKGDVGVGSVKFNLVYHDYV